MANTNAIVEKLKDVGLRHGEKAGVAIASTLFFVCIGLAAKKETIKTTPEQIKAETHGVGQQPRSPRGSREDHRRVLNRKDIKDSDFAKVVDQQVKTALVPNDYKAVPRVGVARAGGRLDSRYAGLDHGIRSLRLSRPWRLQCL